MDILFQFIYNTEMVPALPEMIYDARAGRYTLIQALYPTFVFDRTFASGMYYSVMCAEDADFNLDDLTLDGVDPHIARAQARDTAAFLQLCQKWDVSQLGASADEPVTADIPTLVFSGDFDPITPPPNGEVAAATIHPSYAYDFPAYGHGAMTSGDCPNEMIAAFVRNPGRAPDAQCIKQEASHVTFITPANTLLSAGIGAFQFEMLQGNVQAFLIPIVLALVLVSIWLFGPIAWLIRRARKQPSEPHLAARLVPWVAAFNSLVAIGFFVIVFVLLVVTALRNDNTIALVLGAPRAWFVVYLVPLFFALCALVLTALVVLAWQRRNWGILRRVYFSCLAVASLGMVVWFALNGILLPGIQ